MAPKLCHTCDGFGKAKDDSACPDCGGTGWAGSKDVSAPPNRLRWLYQRWGGIAVSAIIVLGLVTGGLTLRLNSTTKALAQQEQQIRTLTAALAAKSNHDAPGAISVQTVPDNEIYTLYRSSPIGSDLRVHVGTFDTQSFHEPAQNKQYNYDMCSDAQLNFNERNKGIPVRFWCEEGRFREKK